MTSPRSRAAAAALSLACVLAHAARAADLPPAGAAATKVSPLCGGAAQRGPRVTAGETYRYKLDVLGADVGTFEISTAPAPGQPRGSLVMRSRARTNAFVSTNMGSYEAFAEVQLGPDQTPGRYSENVDEGETHRAQTVEFPPHEGALEVRSTRNGAPDPTTLAATPSVRELLSTWLVLRGISLTEGTPFCAEVYAGRRVWKVTGTVAAREKIDTPLGTFTAARIDTVATRADDASVVRNGHFWVSDDARRLPLVAIAELRGKTLQAQLIDVVGPNAVAAHEPRKSSRNETRAPSGSTSIGRR